MVELPAFTKNYGKSITYFHLNGKGLLPPLHLIEMIKACPNFHHLILNECKIDVETARFLTNMLIRGWENLETLDLSRNEVSDVGSVIAAALSYFNALKILDLSGNKLGNHGAAMIALALEGKNTIQTLNLSENQIEDRGAYKLAKALKSNETLRTLNLSKNDISGSFIGENALAGLIESNHTLETLDLSKNKMGVGYGLLEIAAALQKNTSLKTIDLRENYVRGNKFPGGDDPRLKLV